MSVKIEMDMPKGCRTCRLCGYDHINHEHYCRIQGERVFVLWSYKKRDEFCPLKEIE